MEEEGIVGFRVEERGVLKRYSYSQSGYRELMRALSLFCVFSISKTFLANL
jgi:CubicO group peptidase (beta-lactamase class C family)